MTIEDKMILLVEDNPDDVKLMQRAFKHAGVANPVAVAKDGVEALDFVFARGAFADRTEQPLPMLVVLDLKLPKLDGLEVLKQIRGDERTRYLPVVILTSSIEEQDMVSGYALGANSYVRKPVDFTQFVDAAKLLGMYWLMVNQPPPEGAHR
jgi:two-component system response regulator